MLEKITELISLGYKVTFKQEGYNDYRVILRHEKGRSEMGSYPRDHLTEAKVVDLLNYLHDKLR